MHHLFYLPLQDVDFPVLDVYLVSEVTQLVGDPVLVLGGVQGCLGLLLYQLVLLLQLASQLVNLQHKTVRLKDIILHAFQAEIMEDNGNVA